MVFKTEKHLWCLLIFIQYNMNAHELLIQLKKWKVIYNLVISMLFPYPFSAFTSSSYYPEFGIYLTIFLLKNSDVFKNFSNSYTYVCASMDAHSHTCSLKVFQGLEIALRLRQLFSICLQLWPQPGLNPDTAYGPLSTTRHDS